MIDTINDRIFFETALLFLHRIGIKAVFGVHCDGAGFLPGFLIENGEIIMDKNKIKFHGDLLHEAGHIAVVPLADRSRLNGKNLGERKDAAAEEMMAIAWAYAACIYLNIDPHFVFHEQGYRGGAAGIVENFEKGNYFGVPVLEWLGMTRTVPGAENKLVYPVMIKWLRD